MIAQFYGFDIHKEYVMVVAVDSAQRVSLQPKRIAMAELPDWVAQHLTRADQVVLEVAVTPGQ